MADPAPTKTVSNPRIAKLIELETRGVIKPEHEQELNTYRAQGIAPGRSTNSESERTAGFLGSNVGTSLLELEAISKRNPGALKPYIGTNMLGGDKSLLGNWHNDPDRRQAAGAQDLLLDNALTLGTGAAYNKEQFDAYKAAYLPQAFDDAATVEAKANRTRALLNAAKTKAGGSSEDIDRAMTAFGFALKKPAAAKPTDAPAAAAPDQPPNWRVPGADTGGGDIGFADKAHMEANSLPQGAQEFQQQLSEAINSGQLKTADDVVAFGRASKLNEGRGFDIDAKQAQANLDYVKKGGAANVNTPEFQKPDISADRGQGGIAETGKAFIRGIPNIVGADDELNAVADTFQGGTLRDNLAKERAIRDYDEQNHGLARGAGTLAAAFAIPTTAPDVALAAGVDTLRAGDGIVAARAAARGAFARRSATEGAGLAAAYGVGSSDGNIGDRLVSGGVDAATGAATAFGLTKLGQAAASRSPRLGRLLGIGGDEPPGGAPPPNTVGPSNGRAVSEAADRLNIPVMPADVGGPTTGRLTAGAAQSPFGARVIAKAADATVDASRDARNRIATDVGTVADTEGAGEAIHRAADAMRKESSARGGRLYDRAETLAGGAKVEAPTAVAALDKHITDLSEMGNTNAPALKVLNGLKGDLVDEAGNPRQLSIQGLRQLRTNTRDRIMQEGLRGSDLERRVGEVLDGVGADIEAGLTSAGKPDAAAAYKAADAFWKDRVDQIDNVLAPIIGKKGEKGATDAFQAVERLAGPRGDPKRLSRLMAAMPEDEANSVRATVISRLGQATAGKQNAEGDVFSSSTFLTNWNNLSNRAKAVLFDPKTRSALDDLAKVTGGTKAAQQYAGFSNTGAINAVNKTTASLSVATGLLFTGHPILAALTASPALGQYVTARMMTSPIMVRWLTRAPANPAAMNDHIAKLAGIAARNPQIAGEIGSLEKALYSAVNDNGSLTAAASDQKKQANGSNR